MNPKKKHNPQGKLPQKPAPPSTAHQMEITKMPKLDLAIQRAPEDEELHQRTYGNKKPWTRFEVWSVVFAALMFGVTIISIGVYVFQLIEMRKATDASVRAAQAAEKAIKSSQDSIHTDQRAWLGIKPDFKMPSIGEQIVTKLTISNVGRTPAIKTHFVGYISIGPTKFTKYSEIEKIGKFSQDDFTSNVTIFPTSDYIVVLATQARIEAEGEIKGIKEGVNLIHVGGSIIYEDIFGSTHFTNFFGRYNPKTNGFDVSADHNDAN
jgi:hypothetical protein